MMMIIIIINAMSVERVTYDHISYNWSYRNGNISFIQSFGSNDEKAFSSFTTHSKVKACGLQIEVWAVEMGTSARERTALTRDRYTWPCVWRRENVVPPSKLEPLTFQPVAGHYPPPHPPCVRLI